MNKQSIQTMLASEGWNDFKTLLNEEKGRLLDERMNIEGKESEIGNRYLQIKTGLELFDGVIKRLEQFKTQDAQDKEIYI